MNSKIPEHIIENARSDVKKMEEALRVLQEQKTESGESLPTKFQLVHGEDRYEVASLSDVCPAVRQIGGKGVEIKRFKGLGEMNADQLWDTTMNPDTRRLVQMRLDRALIGKVRTAFELLMDAGEAEGRRNWMREHCKSVEADV